MASAAHKIAAAPAAEPVLPDELLEDIFLRLDEASDLARAYAACTAFRRVVSARRFLRRFRSLHPPPVLGLLEHDATAGEFHPAEPPHRSAPAARALAEAADFTFSFLPGPYYWRVRDARDGRVLLYRCTSFASYYSVDLVVCDPLHRRYVLMPPIPGDLVESIKDRGMSNFDTFLDPATKEEPEMADLSFGVICAVRCQYELVTFHFSSVSGKWRGPTFHRTSYDTLKHRGHFKRHYAHGCFYWTIGSSSPMFMQDEREMILSVVDLPGDILTYPPHKAVVEAGEDRLGLLVPGNGILNLYCRTLQNNFVGTEEWQYDKTIPLPELDGSWWILGASKGYVLLMLIPPYSAEQMPERQYFQLDLKTWLVEKLCVSNQPGLIRRACLYESFPPPLSPPSL